MSNIALTINFNGSRYHGWQRQNNAITVEQTVSKAISKITGENPNLIGCSRTDAGVHALEYVCNFESKTSIPPDKIPFALNTALPDDIRVQNSKIVSDDFHARFSATSKTYIYKAYNSQIADPFLTNFAYHFPYEINIEEIRKAAKHFIGQHDFSAFMSSGGSQKTTVRNVTELNISVNNNDIMFRITANAYLYNMVRIISGTLLYVGIGRIDQNDIPDIIQSGDRKRSGITAGPMGLYLAKVEYLY